jgi:sterol desaturase/sphingolipid hydroxylase (fatty acid hydroxylase superfamily)
MLHENILRLGVFLGVLATLAALEHLAPRRARRAPRMARWRTNLGLTVINAAALWAMALAVPLLAIGAALAAEARGIGLLHALAVPQWARIVLAMLLLDFVIWAQHLLSHKVPLFWRFHQMHHADRDMDVTTGLRFHPVEILVSMGVKIGAVTALGAPPLAVLLFEIVLNGTALFNHANLHLPLWLDRALRWVLVTPDMHRVHHSDIRAEHDSNFGFALSIWDRIFGTYTGQPMLGHGSMTVGLTWQDNKPTRLGWSLAVPFRRRP